MSEASTIDDDFRAIVVSGFREHGMSHEAADGLAEFVDNASVIRSKVLLQVFLDRVRHTRAGTALLLALGDAEGLRPAARRLHCSPGSLSELVSEFEAALRTDRKSVV